MRNKLLSAVAGFALLGLDAASAKAQAVTSVPQPFFQNVCTGGQQSQTFPGIFKVGQTVVSAMIELSAVAGYNPGPGNANVEAWVQDPGIIGAQTELATLSPDGTSTHLFPFPGFHQTGPVFTSGGFPVIAATQGVISYICPKGTSLLGSVVYGVSP